MPHASHNWATAYSTVKRMGVVNSIRSSGPRSEEHTSELQSHSDLVCRLLLEKKKKTNTKTKLHEIASITKQTQVSLNADRRWTNGTWQNGPVESYVSTRHDVYSVDATVDAEP